MERNKPNPLKQHDLSEQENITLRQQRGYSIRESHQHRDDQVVTMQDERTEREAAAKEEDEA
jgi:hypothetical protein